MAGKQRLDMSSFSRLFDKSYTPLSLFAFKYLEDLDLAKDLVQDVFVKIWEDAIVFNSEQTIKAYLYTSVRNKCLDHLKSKSYRSRVNLSKEKMEELESEPFFLREVVVQEASVLIEKAINTLPAKCAQIIRLSAKGLSNDSIAEKLGLSVNTVKTQKKIAYSRMRPLLREYFVFLFFLLQS